MAFRRGYPAELELVELLRKPGFYAVRVPVSGGRGFPCDVLAAKGEDRRARTYLCPFLLYPFLARAKAPKQEYCATAFLLERFLSMVQRRAVYGAK